MTRLKQRAVAFARGAVRRLPQSFRYRARQALFFGTSETCEICYSSVRRLRAHGGGPAVLDRRRVAGGMWKDRDRCPVCHGRDRTRAIKSRLVQLIEHSKPPLRILHVAPEYGLTRWLAGLSNVEYTVTDLDAFRYRDFDHFVQADLTQLPFPDGSFDVVICSHVLEHIPDHQAAMSEILRVLAPKGEALIMVPEADDGQPTDEDASVTTPEARTERFGQWDHVRLYSRGDLGARLRSVGFEVVVHEPGSGARAAESLYLARRVALADALLVDNGDEFVPRNNASHG